MHRLELEAAFKVTIKDLVKIAKDNPDEYVVTEDHCFMRICYDLAVGERWTNVVQSPAIKNLSEQQLLVAALIAAEMKYSPDTVRVSNELSLEYRGLLQPDYVI